jgi:hypothetical protein
VSESQAQALIANIRLGWKGLTGTNTLAYFTSSSLTKNFFNVDNSGQFHKTFWHNLRFCRFCLNFDLGLCKLGRKKFYEIDTRLKSKKALLKTVTP